MAFLYYRAAQKLGKKKRRHQPTQPDTPSFPTKFYEIVRTNPPPVPPCLLRTVGRAQNPGVGKVRLPIYRKVIWMPVNIKGNHIRHYEYK